MSNLSTGLEQKLGRLEPFIYSPIISVYYAI